MRKKKLLEKILTELRNMHYHMDRLEVFYKLVHGIKEDGKTGAWIEDRDKSRKGRGAKSG